jgi:hypothetical protein
MTTSDATADLLTAALAREIADSGIRVFAITSPASVAAGLAARELGGGDLALATGFTALDGSPVPNVTLGEAGLFTAGAAPADDPFDTFVLLVRGRAGVAVTPAQLDAAGRTNLSGVGTPGAPKVALPGARGLPDNNVGPSRVWYLFAAHSPRALVERVDVVCGGAPFGRGDRRPGDRGARRLLTPAGCFELDAEGWRAVWLTPAGPELVAGTPGLRVRVAEDTPIVDAPDPEALAAVRCADPHDVRAIEFSGTADASERFAAAAARELLP